MTPLSIAFVATAAICALVGIQHVVVGLRVREPRSYLLFGTAAVAAAVDALVQRRFSVADSPMEFESLFAWSALSICTFLVLLLWFIDARTGAVRRGLLVAETTLLAVTAVLDFVLPAGSHATMDVTGVREAFLPWGEIITRAVGDPSPWRLVGDLANLGLLVLLLDTTIRLVRRDRRREAWLTGASLLLLALSVLAIIPMDLGLVDLPSMHPFAFLLIVALMAWDLSDSAVRAAELSRELMANERRWRQLLKSIQLLVVGIDREGQITFMNPCAEEVSGYPAHEMVGRNYLDFVAERERDDVRSAVDRGLRGDPEPENERILITRDGGERVIRWRSVVLRGPDGEVESLLSVGADETTRRESEAALRHTAAELERSVAELEELRNRLEEENVYLREEVRSEHGFEGIVGCSDALLYVLHKVRQVAPSDTSVLVLGESGVGKELIARTIHDESPRSRRPFVVVNCAALSPSLIESELFGHERGAFTGAERQRRGRFELADGGTIFLDEIGELPLEVQPKLLRVLQDGNFERVGGTGTIPADVRVIAATNRDLEAEVEARTFREDLYYRIAVFPITVPPLRDRREDIRLLVEHFARHFARRRGQPIDEIPAELMRRLESYHWPGNVRELQNVIERAVLTTTGDVLRLAEPLGESAASNGGAEAAAPSTAGRTMAEVERRHIVEVLSSTGGQVSGAGGAAEILGLHANTLRYRMKKLGITVGRKTGTVSTD